MHLLDLVMWLLIMGIIWFLLDKFGEGEYTQEICALIGIRILIVYSVIYFIVFVWPIDVNWIDIFNGKYGSDFSNWFKL